MSDDIIRDVLERVMAAEPSMTAERVDAIERAARAFWGGERAYVFKRFRHLGDARERVLHDALVAAMPLQQIEERYSISRRTIYRLLRNAKNG